MWRRRERGGRGSEREREKRAERGETHLKIEDRNLRKGKGAQRKRENEDGR